MIADIEKKAQTLSILADLHKAEAAVHDEAIKVASEAKAFAQKEAARAEAIAAKFKALVSG